MKCPKCQSTNVIGIEYCLTSPNHYDGISEIQCRECNKRYGRWTGKELENGEEELRFGTSYPKINGKDINDVMYEKKED